MSSSSSHKLCMIPGPIEFHEDVLGAMATPATSHIDPGFINTFGETLEGLRTVVGTKTGQPFVVAGSGTFSWDLALANVVKPGDKALVVSTGLFGDRMVDCLEVFGAEVQVLRPEQLGGVPSTEAIKQALEQGPFKLITVTQVDTSTGVLVDVQQVADIVHQVSPQTLVAVDGVCSVAAEELLMDDWGVDLVMTASQKALGCPPGLAVVIASTRALDAWKRRSTPVPSYYGAWSRWLPVMQAYESRKPLYFATPAVQLIMALHVGILQLLARGMPCVYEAHRQTSDQFKRTIRALGLKTLPLTESVAAHSMTAVYYPTGITAPDLLPRLSQRGILAAGGVHPAMAPKYFRVGHMGLTALEPERQYVTKTEDALKASLQEAGYHPAQ
ncbi:hypothetical protein H4R35_005550 [Dimargaris xerosporica]|nr:hypothetical protein H4R35_005550 [Dimargaris xerosporica]